MLVLHLATIIQLNWFGIFGWGNLLAIWCVESLIFRSAFFNTDSEHSISKVWRSKFSELAIWQIGVVPLSFENCECWLPDHADRDREQAYQTEGEGDRRPPGQGGDHRDRHDRRNRSGQIIGIFSLCRLNTTLHKQDSKHFGDFCDAVLFFSCSQAIQ